MINQTHKQCTECNELVCVYLFTKKNAKCKPCLNKLWKIWYQNNKEKAKQLKDSWNAKNIEKRRIIRNEWHKNKRATDPVYKLKANLRSLVWIAFNKKSFTKKSKITDILGCDLDFFKEYIEFQFTKEMTWYNIHLDHIKPLHTAITEQDVLNLNHYTNFQPLLAKDNLIKNGKLVEQQLKLL